LSIVDENGVAVTQIHFVLLFDFVYIALEERL